MLINRRTALTTLVAATAAAIAPPAEARQEKSEAFPMTGTDNPAFAPFDELITGFMRARRIPGGSLAVVRLGRLVYARGYGWADQEAKVPFAPTHLFRIASLSKSLTAAATGALVQAGKLNLDDRAFARLDLKAHLEPGATIDPRLKTITVRQLLQHSGGFDRGASFDPMFRPAEIARALGVPSPPGARDIIRYMMGRPLDFAPGTKFAYSNFGYCVLGRLIETLTGSPYEDFVKKTILEPIGITQMRIGKSRFADRAPNEVRYYDGAGRSAPSLFPVDKSASVPVPYGAWCIEAMDSHGGWLASAVDMARFAAMLDTRSDGHWITMRTRALFYERPAPPLGLEADGSLSPAYYGMGWQVRPIAIGRANYWHSGKLDGSSSLMVRRHDGLSWVLFFNSESVGPESLAPLLDGPLHGAADAVAPWPMQNLFTRFGITS